MSTNKFIGVAYWTVSTTLSDWATKAAKILQPLHQDGLASINLDQLPAGSQITVRFGEEKHQMIINDGKGRGTVRSCVSAGQFVVCLVALRMQLGDITLVTDSQDPVPTLLRESYPLYAESWQRVHPVAQSLGLTTSEGFKVRNASIFNQVF